ncbi:MAG: hypothetical protein WD875_09655 [Pirellulales bacterium]
MLTFGYTPDGPGATEPTALAALAFLAERDFDGARGACTWLAQHQNRDGSLGVCEGQADPCWPTSLAILAWETAIVRRPWPGVEGLRPAVRAALEWLTTTKGESLRRNPQFGHDTTLVGWPWVAGTHSWIEPTAFAVMALRATGNAEHPRCQQAIRLLIDRQLSTGGCNYGNTFVLGQELLPHTLPSAISLLALARFNIDDPRIEKSLKWLHEAVEHEHGTPSLCFGLLALAAHDRPHPKTNALIAAAEHRVSKRRASGYQLALLSHAALGASSPLVPSPQTARIA